MSPATPCQFDKLAHTNTVIYVNVCFGPPEALGHDGQFEPWDAEG